MPDVGLLYHFAGNGDGRIARMARITVDSDGCGVGMATAAVRAERRGVGNGRVYHIGFTASDGYGRVCTSEVK